jgi:hypothetical protein
MPFREPFNSHYQKLYSPAIRKIGLVPRRGDDESGPGIVVDQLIRMIQESRVLVADLTDHNPNVLYEIGMAHAWGKPVVLLAAAHQEIPFDVRHRRCLIYDKDDPAWGAKLAKSLRSSLQELLANDVEPAVQRFFQPTPRPSPPPLQDSDYIGVGDSSGIWA